MDSKHAERIQQLTEMQVDLTAFEQRYAMPSAEFFDKFERGELGDAIDFFEWSATWQMAENLKRRIQQASAIDV